MATAQASEDIATTARRLIRDIPDYPKTGIIFKDITPLLANPAAFQATTDAMAAPFANAGISHVVAVESRGFILGGPVAQRLGAAFVPVRKPGKLPAATKRETYDLEYGTDALEIHADACTAEARVLIVDDVLATGGTASAVAKLVEKLGGSVAGLSFVIELGFLNGRHKLPGYDIQALVHY